MSIEDFVTYEQALKLKELGFNEPCYNFWSLEPDGKPFIITSTLGDVRSSDLKGRDVTAPFLWQAQKWLREVKNRIVLPTCNLDYENGHSWYWFVDANVEVEDPECSYNSP